MIRFAFFLPLALAGCTSVTSPTAEPANDPHLLQLLFEDARSIEAHIAGDFACLSLRQGQVDRDPPTTVVDELARRWKVPVIAGSRCSVTGGARTVSAPGVTGTGKWLRIANLECRDANHCTADVSYYVANLGAGGRKVIIERLGTGWRITPTGSMWIS